MNCNSQNFSSPLSAHYSMIPSSGSVTLKRVRTPCCRWDLAACFKMQCFICVTYFMIICSAYPSKIRETTKVHEKRSLFHDVIESLRIRAHLPEDFNPNDENNLSQNYERYGFENEPLQLPGDSEFMPRRNDRIEMPSLKYRFPKNLSGNDSIIESSPKEEIVLYIDSPNDTPMKPSTLKPKRQNRPRPQVNKKPNKNNNVDNDTDDSEAIMENNMPSNNLAGQSQIGNRDTQTVVKPTVIVNFRGTVTHRESEIRLERRNNNETKLEVPQNVFNIKQEVNLERTRSNTGAKGSKKEQNKPTQVLKITDEDNKPKIEEDMMMCESNSWKETSGRGSKKYNVLQILLRI